MMRSGWLRTLVWVFALVASFGAKSGAQEPRVRSSLTSKGDVWVGQRVTLVIELLAPGYFSGVPAFELPSVPGMLLVPPIGSPVVSSEEISGASYTVQRHELSVFARRSGEQVIPPIPVRFQFKRQPLDKDPVSASVKTEPLKFGVKAPPGAEGLGNILSARGLVATETWKPEPGKAKAGDAFTQVVFFSATDVPGMAFPPFPAPTVEGLGVYLKPPEVSDKDERGEIHGERRDSITYVCQRPGRFVIPGARLTWFDLDAQELKVIEFPERVLEVAANPAMASNAVPTEPGRSFTWRGLGIAVSLVAASAVMAWAILRFGMRWFQPFRAIHLAPLNPAPTREKL